MHTIVGHCPHCGAPVYAPTVWNSILPPPSTPSCGCAARTHVTINTNTSGYPPLLSRPDAPKTEG